MRSPTSSGLTAFLDNLPATQAGFLRGSGFSARPDELSLLPGGDGVQAAVLGLGEDRTPFAFGSLANRLPEGTWRIEPGDFDEASSVLGFCLGAYRYAEFKAAKRALDPHAILNPGVLVDP